MSTGQGVLGTNMYAYCRNNPVNRCDPSGAVDTKAKVAFDIFEKAMPIAENIFGKDTTISNVAPEIAAGVAGSGPSGWKIAGVAWALFGYALDYAAHAEMDRERTMLMYEATMHRQIAKIAEKFGNKRCKEAAIAIEGHLKEKGWSFRVVGIVFPQARDGMLVSDNYLNGSEAISDNYWHIGIEFKGLVHDNITPHGIPLDDWVNSIHGHGKGFVEFANSVHEVIEKLSLRRALMS